MAFLIAADLAAFADIPPAKAAEMIADATALAVLNAPCLGHPDELSEDQVAAVKAILRGAILRWDDAGSGALSAQTVGPFSQTYDNRQNRRGMFWPTEIDQLQAICKGDALGGAFAVDTVGCGPVVHSEACALMFGALYCSCGASLSLGYPLWEGPW